MRRLAIALLALTAAAASLGACVGRGNAITVHALFDDVGDLPRFSNVQSLDVVIGQVTGIRLEGYHARVTMRIDRNARIPSNAIALVRSTSLLGEKFVDLRAAEDAPPAPGLLQDGGVIPVERTRRLPGVDDAFNKLGRILEGGSAAALATVIHSSATIVRGREEALGQIFTELRSMSSVLAVRAPEIASAITDLDTAFSALAAGEGVIRRVLRSGADAASILADEQENLDRLVGSLDRASSVLARYSKATTPSSDAALKDLRDVLDVVMTTTDDLEAAVSALASFTDLWPRAIPGDYIQLDIALTLAEETPSEASAASARAQTRELRRLQELAELLWGTVR
ncbi:MAG TPA: MCE family protein [Actinomycetota bacterium]|nr:MCE family protein [Actinomycetota bacterium]